MSEGPAKAKAPIVPDHTKITSGTEVQEKLILAARVFSDLLKPTFGPRGLDKMLYKTDGNTAVTNDGAKIVAELLVKHPAAKMMVSMASSQEENCGDGVTSSMLVCGSLLIQGKALLRKGLHPLTLIDGYSHALDAAIDQIELDSSHATSDKLLGVSETALRGKVADTSLDELSPIVVQALQTVFDSSGTAHAEQVSMYKIGTGSIKDSRLVFGVVFRRRVISDDLPNNLEDIKVICLNGDLKIRELTRDVEIKITSADELESFVEAEQDRRAQIAESVVNSGASAILCTGQVDKDVLHTLSKSGIFAVGDLDDSEIRNAAEATGATIVENPLDISNSELGECGNLSWERKQETDSVQDIIRLESCPNPRTVTIEVGGSGETATEEVIRALHDSLRATSLAFIEEVLPGAGSIHARMAHSVRVASESQPGKERLAMEAFARALEAIPETLAENGGGEPLDRILELRAAAREGRISGISPDGKLCDVEGVWHPRSVIEEALVSATETASSMLRIDQVISSRGD